MSLAYVGRTSVYSLLLGALLTGLTYAGQRMLGASDFNWSLAGPILALFTVCFSAFLAFFRVGLGVTVLLLVALGSLAMLAGFRYFSSF